MKEATWQIFAAIWIGLYLGFLFLKFSVEYFVTMYRNWRDWKISVRDEIKFLCERVEDADTTP